MNEIHIECARCKKSAEGGLSYLLNGPATGHNKERGVLCPDCVKALRWFMRPTEHVKSSEAVTGASLAHIATCPECNYRYGGSGVPTLQKRADVARMFSDGGYAQ